METTSRKSEADREDGEGRQAGGRGPARGRTPSLIEGSRPRVRRRSRKAAQPAFQLGSGTTRFALPHCPSSSFAPGRGLGNRVGGANCGTGGEGSGTADAPPGLAARVPGQLTRLPSVLRRRRRRAPRSQGRGLLLSVHFLIHYRVFSPRVFNLCLFLFCIPK